MFPEIIYSIFVFVFLFTLFLHRRLSRVDDSRDADLLSLELGNAFYRWDGQRWCTSPVRPFKISILVVISYFMLLSVLNI